jgi:hypothetical protein
MEKDMKGMELGMAMTSVRWEVQELVNIKECITAGCMWGNFLLATFFQPRKDDRRLKVIVISRESWIIAT